MNFNLLKPMAIFATVVEQKTFTKAGLVLNMPRGKVSEQIKRLENQLGVKLLQRNTRNVTITEEGQALFDHVQALKTIASRGMNEVNSYSSEIKGIIRITATDDFYEQFLLPILKAFSAKFPKVLFDIQTSENNLPIVANSIDIAIRANGLVDSDLIAYPLFQTALKLYASPVLENLSKVNYPDDLTNFNWVNISSNKVKNIHLKHENGEVYDFMPTRYHNANNINNYSRLLENGFGIGLMAENSANKMVQKGLLMPILPEWRSEELQISLFYPSRKHMARRTKLLIEDIKTSSRLFSGH